MPVGCPCLVTPMSWRDVMVLHGTLLLVTQWDALLLRFIVISQRGIAAKYMLGAAQQIRLNMLCSAPVCGLTITGWGS